MIKAVQFLNQIQAGLGKDERMDIEPQAQPGAVGMGMLLKSMLLKKDADIVGTVICGDNYFLENKEKSMQILADRVKEFNADVVICGPALNHKRYGECCGYLAKYINDECGIPAFAAMASSSTGTPIFKSKIYIIETPNVGGTGLNSSLKKIANFAVKLAKKEKVGSSEDDGYFAQE